MIKNMAVNLTISKIKCPYKISRSQSLRFNERTLVSKVEIVFCSGLALPLHPSLLTFASVPLSYYYQPTKYLLNCSTPLPKVGLTSSPIPRQQLSTLKKSPIVDWLLAEQWVLEQLRCVVGFGEISAGGAFVPRPYPGQSSGIGIHYGSGPRHRHHPPRAPT